MASRTTDRLPALANPHMASLHEAHEAAARVCAPLRFDFEVAGHPMRCTFAGDDLAQAITLGFQHLRQDAGGPAGLAVELWDIGASGVQRPLPDMRRLIDWHRTYADGLVAKGEGLLGYQSPRLYVMIDLAEGRMIGCVTDAADLSAYEIGKPLQPLLFAWLQSRTVQPIHAALIAQEGKGLLLGGKGGSGKSTTALACARAGMQFLGDDYVGIERLHGGFVGHSLYASAWLEKGHSRRFSAMGKHRMPGKDSGERKQSFAIATAAPGATRAKCTISAVAIPRIVDSENSSFAPIERHETALRLAPSAVLQMAHLDRAEIFGIAQDLVATLPCFELRIGSRLDLIPDAVSKLLAELRK